MAEGYFDDGTVQIEPDTYVFATPGGEGDVIDLLRETGASRPYTPSGSEESAERGFPQNLALGVSPVPPCRRDSHVQNASAAGGFSGPIRHATEGAEKGGACAGKADVPPGDSETLPSASRLPIKQLSKEDRRLMQKLLMANRDGACVALSALLLLHLM